MAISRVTTWSAGQVLTAAALNGEFNNILNNPIALWSPAASAINFNGQVLTLDAAAVTTVASSASQAWQFTPGAKTGTPGSTGSISNWVASTYTDNNTAASGTATQFAAHALQRPTLAASNTGVITTDAATLYIANSPLAGTNETLTNAWAIQVASGNVKFPGTSNNVGTVTSGTWNGTPITGNYLALRSYLAGLTLSTAGASSTMSIAAGQASDSTNALLMTLASAMSKTTSSWAVGTGNGGLDTGTIATSTWYHFYVIQRTDLTAVDVLFSTSASSPTMPANYTYKRRIGSGLTNGSSQWTTFAQDGDYFMWATAIQDYNTTNPGTGSVTVTLSVTTGVSVWAIFNINIYAFTNNNNVIFIRDLGMATTDQTPTVGPSTAPGGMMYAASADQQDGYYTLHTNTSAQVAYRALRSDGLTNVRFNTVGWIDRRGRDN